MILEIELLRFNEMPQPSFDNLDPVLRAGALRIAHRLRDAGEEAWLVGGAVRNLALGLPAADADLATGALPDRVLELFPRSLAVGKAFGTIIVRPGEERWSESEQSSDPELSPQQMGELNALDVEVTTFRSEEGYSDGRRPDEVRFGADAAEDAQRRDFTCNALFLEVLTGRLFDPTGGLADLEARRLRCVGDPLGRFSEDGLRLLRLARFHARYDLQVEAETILAARACRDVLSGMSSERRLQELKKLFSHAGSVRGVALMEEIGLWEQVFAGSGLAIASHPEKPVAALFDHLSDPPGEEMGLAALLTGLASDLSPERCEEAILALHGPRSIARKTAEIVRLAQRLERSMAEAEDLDDRADKIRLLREPSFEVGLQLALARNPNVAHDNFEAFQRLGLLSAERAVLSEQELRPDPLLNGADLLEAGIPRGPLFGEILRDLEDHQLRAELTGREAALRWLAELAEGYDGGNTRRSE